MLHKSMNYKKLRNLSAVYVALIASFGLGGCATAGSVKKQIAKDLYEIVEKQDCDTVCYLLKEYVAHELEKVGESESK